MLDPIAPGGAAPLAGATLDPPGSPEIVEWLRSGRLTLVDETRKPVPADRWHDLPPETRRRALAEFQRVVRGNAKAAVIYLAPP
jgi:hypothetical protein